MAHDVFISHSTQDKAVADAACATLEGRKIRCWIAPRDILPGMDWGEAIIDAIGGAKVMVLIFSNHSNTSDQVKREVQNAVGEGVAILPFRIEDVTPIKSLRYFLGTQHWLDALTTPLERHLDRLADTVSALLARMTESPNGEAEPKPAIAANPTLTPLHQPDSGGLDERASALNERLQRLREDGERKRAELEEPERRRKEEEFELLQGTLAQQLDREAFDEAWKTVGDLRKLKPDDPEVQEAAKLIAEQMAHWGGGSVLMLPRGVNMEFVPIPPGTFLMGSPESEPGRTASEGPQHAVTIAYPFSMGKYPVTQAQWQAVMGTSVADQRNKTGNLFLPLEGEGPDYPMYYVSWHEVQEFIQKVNAMGQGVFRLPSEAEWEYACRAGTQTRYYFGDNEAELGEYAWYAANSGQTTHPVGQKKPNAWGLHDMHGNVWECCQDWYRHNHNGVPADGSACETPSIQFRVVRGGPWFSLPEGCRAALRDGLKPTDRLHYLGFRLLRTRS